MIDYSKEMWRPVVGFDGYEVSNMGRVRSWRSNNPNVLLPFPKIMRYHRTKGEFYLGVTLARNRKPFNRNMHVLVAEAWIGPRPDGMQVCHLNGDASDNRADNLRWDTPKANCADRNLHGTAIKGERVGIAKLTDLKVIEIYLSLEETDTLAEKYSMNRSCINDIRSRRTWKHVTDHLVGKKEKVVSDAIKKLTIEELDIYSKRIGVI